MATATAKRDSTGSKIDVAELRRALAAVAPAVGSRGVDSAMLGVLVMQNSMSCTDGEMRIDVAVGCGVECVIPHSRLTAIVNSCPQDEQISFSLKTDSCAVKCGSGRWVMPTIDPSLFPKWDVGKTSAGLSLPCDQLESAMSSVLVAADRTGPLSSVVIEVTDRGAVFAALDGRRVALAEVEHDLAVDRSVVVLPARAAAAIAKLAGVYGGEEEAQFRLSSSAVRVTIGDAVVTCSQVAAQVPDYKKIDSEIGDGVVVVDRSEFAAAARAAAAVASETSRGVCATCSATSVTLCCKSSEYGSSKVECPVFVSDNVPEFCVNPWYMVGWLAALPAECDPHVEISVSSGNVVMRCGEYRTVIMPIATV